MRVGKKHNVVEGKKTRSCVVRLEKVSTSSPNVSPSQEENRNLTRSNRLNTIGMGATPKGRKGVISSHQEDKSISVTAKKKIIGRGTAIHSLVQNPHYQKNANNTMSNIRSNQKTKIIPRSNKTTPASTPSREETPPPTIAAGRSRRAIKPNPKYASEDMVTPKVIRNVGMLAASSANRGQSRTRKASTSSDDFYNRNSEDEYESYENNMENDDDNDEELQDDKAYQASEKDNDSDFSVIEEVPARTVRSRGRPKRNQESTQATAQVTNNKIVTQTPILKRPSTTITSNLSNTRSAPSQLQQIRRSLASANAQRNVNLLMESGGRGTHKRKLDEIQDASDTDSSYPVKRKQLLLSNSSGLKVKLPVRENKFNVTPTSLTKSRVITQSQVHKTLQQQSVNGSNNTVLASSRRSMEIVAKYNSDSFAKSTRQAVINVNQNKTINANAITTQAQILALKAQRFRNGSPKLPIQKERQNNGASILISSSTSSSSLNTNSKTTDNTKSYNTQSTLKSKTATPHNSIAINSEIVHEIKDDSPNSTIDDFETMPTFTIVNVNDIINKKGDVLITKTNTNKTPTVIELSESISLDDDEVDDSNNTNEDVEEVEEVIPALTRRKQGLSKNLPNLATINNNRKEIVIKKSSLIRSNETSCKKLPISTTSSNQAPQILNHKLGLRNSRVTPKTTTTISASPDKPAPRILNSMVAKKTQPVKPMIANMDDSADESFPLSLDEDEDEEEQTEDEVESRNLKARNRHYQNVMEVDAEDTESQNTEGDDIVLQTSNTAATNLSASKVAALTPKQNTAPQRRRRIAGISNTPIIVSSNKKRLTPAATKENSLAATNQQVNDITSKQPITSALPVRKSNTEKVVISRQGDKIIKKITCFETWYVINMPAEPKRPATMKNQLEMPLIRLANHVKSICLPNHLWSSKVNLYELSPQILVKGTFATYTGDLYDHKISEEDRGKYQPSCVMFRRSVDKNQPSRMPYDRAVIFKNKTFYTNIEGKNVRLVGAPGIINSETEIEIMLAVVDSLTLQSEFIEHISIVQ